MTAQIIEFTTRKTLMLGQIARTIERQSYHIHIEPSEDGFDWWLCSDDPNIDTEPHHDDVAADLAAIALSLRPPQRSFLERLIALVFGDPD